MTISTTTTTTTTTTPSTPTPKSTTTIKETTTTKETVTTYTRKDTKLESPLTPTINTSAPTATSTPRIINDNTLYTWENPFRPDGDLSKEADTIVELIKEGKAINEENIRARSPGPGMMKQPSEVQYTTTNSGNLLSAAPPTSNKTKSSDPSIVSTTLVPSPNQGSNVEVVNLKDKKDKGKGCCSVV